MESKGLRFTAGLDGRYEGGRVAVRPVAEASVAIPVVRTAHLEACTLSVSDARTSLGGRFRVPAGKLSLKGSARISVRHGQRRPELKFSVMPTEKAVVAVGAVAALAAGKRLSTSPRVALVPGVGVEVDVGLRHDRGSGATTLQVRDANVVLQLPSTDL